LLPALVIFVLTGGVLAAQGGSSDQLGAQEGPMVLENNTIEVELDDDGSAYWTVTWTFSLPDNESRDQFRVLAGEFEQGTETEYLETLERFQTANVRVDAARDRQIRITNETRTSNTSGTGPNATGRLTLSFTWENFARVDGDRLVIDDALATEEHGTWLDGLTPEQELIVRIPDGYGVFDANVDPQDGALRWRGPADFNATTLQVTFRGDTGTADPGGSNLMLWVAVGVLLAVIALIGLFVVSRRDSLFPASAPAESDDGPPAGGTPVEPNSGEPSTDATSEAATTENRTVEIDEELLSDEERVERLLEANGGRMKQASIVDETDWSNAKVSQLLSSMEEEGRIDKLRIGRENLISFPDVDVTELEREE